MSRQRQIILTELQKLNTHPTADELFAIVRKILPTISLATVYRNLNLLAEQGLITKLEHGGIQKRFDAEQKLHYHLRCKRCQHIYDLQAEMVPDLAQTINDQQGHEIEGYDLEFYGVCEKCNKKES